jgi:hypothetical protein
MSKHSLRRWARQQMRYNGEPAPNWIRWGLAAAALLVVLKVLGVL